VKRRFDDAASTRQKDEDERVAANPRWFCGRRFRRRDLASAEPPVRRSQRRRQYRRASVAQQKRHGPADAYSECGCLTAITFDGEKLWQNGLADSWNYLLTNDVAVQIHDLDGDGKNEVIYCRDFEIVVADGATGETKYKAATPVARPEAITKRRFPQILGDSMAFADLRGTGHKRDILLKDRYQNLWAFNDKLEQLWTLRLNTGHYPFPIDVDGDGREEILIGYSLLSPDGKILWTNQDKLEDHADGVAIVRFKDGRRAACSLCRQRRGDFLYRSSWKIQQHYQLGHVQNPSVADYRPDLPGLETVTVNFWGNQGNRSFLRCGWKLVSRLRAVAARQHDVAGELDG
jgi:hypothetical protein